MNESASATMNTTQGRLSISLLALRVCIVAAFFAAFIPNINPARVSALINVNASLFTNVVSYNSIAANFARALNRGWVNQPPLVITYVGALITGLAIAMFVAAFCVSLGNLKMRRLCSKLAMGAGFLGLAGLAVLGIAYSMLLNSPEPSRAEAEFPVMALVVFAVVFILALLSAVFMWFTMPKPADDAKYELDAKYRLFLMILPFLVLIALFAYLPLWGWRYSFFDFRVGSPLSMDDWVGLQWFRMLFENPATQASILRVVRNTLGMSFLGLAFSWLPMVFAIFLSEFRSTKYKRVVQSLTTIPNFISWVLVYSVAFAIFSTDGFFNWILGNFGLVDHATNHLMNSNHIWWQMWAWGTWRGLGWAAIIYIASIASIDPQLYEAATVDGAGRFKRMWHITVPGLLPTFFVLLLLGIANILNSGIEQQLVFYNAANWETIETINLFVFHVGLAQGNHIPLATLIGMTQSIVSLVLLFSANWLSKVLRGQSIV